MKWERGGKSDDAEESNASSDTKPENMVKSDRQPVTGVKLQDCYGLRYNVCLLNLSEIFCVC